MKESCKRLMAEWNRVIWGFILMTTGWKMGIHSQSDQGFAGEKERHEMHLYWWEDPPGTQHMDADGPARGSSSITFHQSPLLCWQLSIATQGCSRGSQDQHRWRYKHMGGDGGEATVETHSEHWAHTAEGSWTQPVLMESTAPLLLISLPFCSSVLTEHSEMLKMGLSVIFTVSYHQG